MNDLPKIFRVSDLVLIQNIFTAGLFYVKTDGFRDISDTLLLLFLDFFFTKQKNFLLN